MPCPPLLTTFPVFENEFFGSSFTFWVTKPPLVSVICNVSVKYPDLLNSTLYVLGSSIPIK